MTANLAIAQLLLSIVLGTVTLIWGIFRYRRSRHRRRGAFKFQAYLLWILTGLIGIGSFMPLAHLYTEHLWVREPRTPGCLLGTPAGPMGHLRCLLPHRPRIHEHQRHHRERTLPRIPRVPTLDTHTNLLLPSRRVLFNLRRSISPRNPDVVAG